MYPGRAEDQKKELTKSITNSLIKVAETKENPISVAIEEIPAEEWPEKVCRPDIVEKQDSLYKKPGYNPLAE